MMMVMMAMNVLPATVMAAKNAALHALETYPGSDQRSKIIIIIIIIIITIIIIIIIAIIIIIIIKIIIIIILMNGRSLLIFGGGLLGLYACCLFREEGFQVNIRKHQKTLENM